MRVVFTDGRVLCVPSSGSPSCILPHPSSVPDTRSAAVEWACTGLSWTRTSRSPD